MKSIGHTAAYVVFEPKGRRSARHQAKIQEDIQQRRHRILVPSETKTNEMTTAVLMSLTELRLAEDHFQELAKTLARESTGPLDDVHPTTPSPQPMVSKPTVATTHTSSVDEETASYVEWQLARVATPKRKRTDASVSSQAKRRRDAPKVPSDLFASYVICFTTVDASASSPSPAGTTQGR